MTQPDDLDPGDYIAITGEKAAEEIDPFLDGAPLKVVAISLPFIAVDDGDEVFAIDIRLATFQKLTRRYVRVMQGKCGRRIYGPVVNNAPPSPYDCPRCGCRMRRIKKQAQPDWIMSCPHCGFERKDI